MALKSRSMTFAFEANLAAQVGLFGVAQILAAADTEIALHNILGPNIASHAIVESATPLITANEVPLVGVALLAPSGYTLKATLSKGTTTVAPDADSFKVGFDTRLSTPLILRAGRYLGIIRTAVNQALSPAVIAREIDTSAHVF